jgi:hypothetical protein
MKRDPRYVRHLARDGWFSRQRLYQNSGIDIGHRADDALVVPPTSVGGEPDGCALTMALIETLGADRLIVEERTYFDATGFAARLGMTG